MQRTEAQFRRVERYYNRLVRISRDMPMGQNYTSPMMKDDIYTFLMTCYHLKDWIKNDAKTLIPDVHNCVENYLTQTPELNVCGDIENGFKHLKLNNSENFATYQSIGSGKCHIMASLGPREWNCYDHRMQSWNFTMDEQCPSVAGHYKP
jgi:hypothetical protein